MQSRVGRRPVSLTGFDRFNLYLNADYLPSYIKLPCFVENVFLPISKNDPKGLQGALVAPLAS